MNKYFSQLLIFLSLILVVAQARATITGSFTFDSGTVSENNGKVGLWYGNTNLTDKTKTSTNISGYTASIGYEEMFWGTRLNYEFHESPVQQADVLQGSSIFTTVSTSYTTTGIGPDIYLRVPVGVVIFYGGLGLEWLTVGLREKFSFNPAVAPLGHDGALSLTGSTIAYKGFVGMHLYFIPRFFGVAVEGTYLMANMNEMTVDNDYNIYSNVSYVKGRVAKRFNSTLDGFASDSVSADLSRVLLRVALLFSF